jgi:hypothetical protein
MLEQLEGWLMAARTYTGAGLRCVQGEQHALAQDRQAYEHSWALIEPSRECWSSWMAD